MAHDMEAAHTAAAAAYLDAWRQTLDQGGNLLPLVERAQDEISASRERAVEAALLRLGEAAGMSHLGSLASRVAATAGGLERIRAALVALAGYAGVSNTVDPGPGLPEHWR